MRRLRRAEARTYYLRPHTAGRNAEGGTVHVYGEPVPIRAVIRHASGARDVEAYGERVTYVLHMQYEGPQELVPGDGVCVYVDGSESPDYAVTSVRGLTERAFKAVELERVM